MSSIDTELIVNKNRYIIACSGKATRWNNYLNSNKHLIKIGNETLLDRTIRLINKFDSNCEICIFAFDEEYKRDETLLCKPTLLPREEHSKYPAIFMTREFWNPTGNTIVLFGDVFYTTNSMKIIYENKNKLNFFGRENGSAITGKTYGELFAISFNKYDQTPILHYLKILELKFKTNKINRFVTWELYKIINNIKLTDHKIKNHFIEINDFTDDFDLPIDYDIWYKNLNNYLRPKIKQQIMNENSNTNVNILDSCFENQFILLITDM